MGMNIQPITVRFEYRYCPGATLQRGYLGLQCTSPYDDSDSYAVRLTLTEGKPLEIRDSYPHEEGYSYDHVTFRLEWSPKTSQHWITRECASGGSDCDGPIDHYHESRKPLWAFLLDMRSGNPFRCDVSGVEWKETRSETVDAYARAAGY